MTEREKPKSHAGVLLLIFVFIIGAWIATPNIIIYWYKYPTEAGGFGDIFGSINALFAGLAFFGIIYTILLQRDELKLQREELKQNTKELHNSANALAEQARLMRDSAVLSALPIVIQQEKNTIYTVDKSFFSDARDESYSAEGLAREIEQFTKKIERLRNQIREDEITLDELKKTRTVARGTPKTRGGTS